MRFLILTLMLMLLAISAQAETLSLEEFSRLIQHLQLPPTVEAEESFVLPQTTRDLCQRLAEVDSIKLPAAHYMVNLSWLNDVLEALQSETSAARRRLLFVNLTDTLNGMVRDMQTANIFNGVSRQEMLAALERAMNRTSQVRIAANSSTDPSISYCGGGAYVIEESGEAISMTQAAPLGRSGAASWNTGPVSGSWSGPETGQSSGSSAGSNSGSSTGSASSSGSGSSSGSSTGQNGNNQSTTSLSSGNTGNNQQTYTNTPTSQPVKPADHVATRQKNPAKPNNPPPPPPKPVQPVAKPAPKAAGSADLVYLVILILSLIGFAILIYFIVRSLHQKIALDNLQTSAIAEDLPPERQQTRTIYEKALQAAADQNYEEAIRLLTIGALLLLEEHRVLNFQETMTNGEYLQELLSKRRLHSIFSRPMALFDKLIYGFQSPDKKDFELFREFYLELEKQEK